MPEMTDPLKRIEAKHERIKGMPCEHRPDGDAYCLSHDVVKLARALDRILKTALPIMEEDTEAFAEGRRTLEEVAGE
jgi:hypothetical protein